MNRRGRGRASSVRLSARAALLLLVLVVDAPACSIVSEAERFIQGSWFYTGTLPGLPQYPTMPFTIEWTFASGTFRQSGYPPIHSEGRYRVVQAGQAAITLTLFQQKGHFSEEDRTIAIAIDRDAGGISIDKGPLLRRKPAAP
jgi:hypothetical protein